MYGTSNFIGQIYFSGYLYVFGTSQTTSYKYDLNRKLIVGQLNVPTVSVNKAFGAVQYEGNIYIFYYKSDKKFAYYIYNPLTDTTGGEVITDTVLTINYYKTNPIYYNKKAYMWTNYLNNCAIFDFETNTVTVNTGISLGQQVRTYIASYGKFVYYKSGHGQDLYKKNLETNQTTTYRNEIPYITGYNSYGCYLYIIGNYLYLLGNTSSGSKTYFNFYYRMNLLTDVFERIETDYSYWVEGVYGDSSNHGTWYANQPGFFDDTTGIFYIRQPAKESNTYALQIENPIDISTAEDGEILLVQTFDSSKPTKIQDDINMYASIDNTYIVDNGVANGGHFSAWGDGNKWNVIKNNDYRRAVVSFDTNGGTGTYNDIEVLSGTSISAPDTEPQKSMHIFKYWELDGKEFKFNSDIVIDDITLVAHYQEYEYVDYIESTGTQYIDTGVVPRSTTRMVLDMEVTDTSTDGLCGWGSSGGAESFFCGTSKNVSYHRASVSSNWTSVTSDIPKDILRHTYDISNTAIKIDGTTYGEGDISNTATDGQTLYLFALHTEYKNGSVYYVATKQKIYSCKIYNGSTLIRDFIPIRIIETNTYCMIDSVNNAVYYNAISGGFIGDGYEPTYIDYIQTNGSQYIDTLFYANQDTKVECKFEPTEFVNDKWAFLFASRSAWHVNEFTVAYHKTNQAWYSGYGNLDVKNTDLLLEVGTKYTIVKDKETCSINSSIIVNDSLDFTSTATLVIFREKQANSTETPRCKLYYFKVWDNGTLVRNLVPCIDYKNTICLWDKVNNKFYYNLGSGSFTYSQ